MSIPGTASLAFLLVWLVRQFGWMA